MTETLSSTEFRRRLSQTLDRVAGSGDEFIIERNGRPVAAVISLRKLRSLDRMTRDFLLAALDHESTLSPEEADALADEAKHASRSSE